MSACGNSSPNDNPLADGAPPNGKRFHRFLRTGHILSSILREILEEKFLHEVSPHTLNRAQFCLLKLIALNVDLQVGEVARWLGVSAAASSKNVDKLERLGLVARAATPTDRRATVLSASPDGQRLVAEYEHLKASRIAPVIDGMGPEKLDMLCGLLEEVCVELLQAEQPLSETCLRCAGYYEEDCSVAYVQGGCALQAHRESHASDSTGKSL